MTATTDERTTTPVGSLPQWFAFLAGPLAWTAHLLVSYPLVPVACAIGGALILNLVTAVTAAVALAGAIVAWRGCRRVREEPRAGGESRGTRRAAFMARTGFVLSVLFVFVILVEASPVWLQDPCDQFPVSPPVIEHQPARGEALSPAELLALPLVAAYARENDPWGY